MATGTGQCVAFPTYFTDPTKPYKLITNFKTSFESSLAMLGNHKGLLERARPLKAGRYIIHQLNGECQLFIRPL